MGARGGEYGDGEIKYISFCLFISVSVVSFFLFFVSL